MRTSLLASCAAAVVLCCASCAADLTGIPAAAPLPETDVLVANPFAADGSPLGVKVVERVSGDCQGSNMAAGNPNARRCFTEDSVVLDPCFVPAGRLPTTALCLTKPTLKEAVEVRINVDDSINPEERSFDVDPWFVLLVNGQECQLLGGATTEFMGLRMNYACGGERYVYGSPDRREDVWEVFYRPSESADLMAVAVRAAWF